MSRQRLIIVAVIAALAVAVTGFVATMPYIALQLVGIQAVLEVAGLGGGDNIVAKDAPLLVHVLARAQVSGKAFKMAAYGALVSAPLSHTLVNALQRFFAGKTGLQARLGMLLASQLIVAPIQIFCECMCCSAGAGRDAYGR